MYVYTQTSLIIEDLVLSAVSRLYLWLYNEFSMDNDSTIIGFYVLDFHGNKSIYKNELSFFLCVCVGGWFYLTALAVLKLELCRPGYP